MENKRSPIENQAENRYELKIEEATAILEYDLSQGVMTLTHTYVPKQLEGRGVGAELVRGALEDIRSKGLRIVPQCEFIAQYIRRHPEWEELVAKNHPQK